MLRPCALSLSPSVLFLTSAPSSKSCWPGVARRPVTFFCFAKRKSPKKRRPAVWVPSLRYGQPALLDYGGGLAKLATLRFAQTTPALIPPPSALLGPARTGQSGSGTEYQIPIPNSNTNKDTPWRVLVSSGIRISVFGCLAVRYSGSPCGCAEERRARRIRDRVV